MRRKNPEIEIGEGPPKGLTEVVVLGQALAPFQGPKQGAPAGAWAAFPYQKTAKSHTPGPQMCFIPLPPRITLLFQARTSTKGLECSFLYGAVSEKGHLLARPRLVFHWKHPQSCGNVLFSTAPGECEVTGQGAPWLDQTEPFQPPAHSPFKLSPKISPVPPTPGCSASPTAG